MFKARCSTIKVPHDLSIYSHSIINHNSNLIRIKSPHSLISLIFCYSVEARSRIKKKLITIVEKRLKIILNNNFKIDNYIVMNVKISDTPQRKKH